MSEVLTPQILLRAYGAGIFPMADSRGSQDLHWIDPRQRGILPLDGFHISKSLRKSIRAANYQVRIDTEFETVLRACAQRDETWINDILFHLYVDLFRLGHAHSLEIWADEQIIGGVYGVTLGAAFFGESMFSRRTDASKIALAWLVDRLRLTGYRLFDTQFLTPHLQSLGAVEISRAAYHERLRSALPHHADITALQAVQTAQEVIQRNTQTS